MSNRNNFLFSYHTDFCDKYCPNRKVGCHSSCEKYTVKKEKYNKQKSEMRNIKLKRRDVIGFEIDSCYKTMKNHHDRFR